MKFYSFAKVVVKSVFSLLYRRKVYGHDNIPKEGGLIIAVNHRSNWDVIFAGLAIKRHLHFLAKKELFEKNIGLTKLVTSLNAFPLNRGTADLKAMKWTISILKQGKVLLLFPEGTRVSEGESVDAKAGIAMFAIKAKVPIVPAAITGNYKLFHKIDVHFGKPIYLDEYYGGYTADDLKFISEGVMADIRALSGGASADGKHK